MASANFRPLPSRFRPIFLKRKPNAFRLAAMPTEHQPEPRTAHDSIADFAPSPPVLRLPKVRRDGRKCPVWRSAETDQGFCRRSAPAGRTLRFLDYGGNRRLVMTVNLQHLPARGFKTPDLINRTGLVDAAVNGMLLLSQKTISFSASNVRPTQSLLRKSLPSNNRRRQ